MEDSIAVVAPEAGVSEHLSAALRDEDRVKTVSTHVLVEEDKVQRLRELSRRTRVAQSEYLREAVEDLLEKYQPCAAKVAL